MSAVLTLLRIRNLALVEELEWQIGPGFVAVTGETGAGKSIIIGALQLLLGERADKSLIRTGADLCTVEAVFSGNDLQKLNPQLAEAGIEPCEERFDPEADSLLNRNESAVHQRVADDIVGVEKSRGRTCRSSWSARSPVVALAGDAIALARFVRARRTTARGISNALSAIADTARRTCRARTRRKPRANRSWICFGTKSPRSNRRTSSRAKKKKSRSATNSPATANG